jgi:hypothetical protein
MILWLQLVAGKRLCAQVLSIVDLRPGHENNKQDPSPSISSDGTVGTETFSAFSMISASVAA